jgi:hypothetical protein
MCRGAVKSLARPTSLSIVFFSVQGKGGSPTGPDPENRVGDQTVESQVGQFLPGCKCPVSRFLPGRVKDLLAPRYCCKLSSMSALDGNGCPKLRPGQFALGKETRYLS